MLDVKKYFTEGMIQVAIFLSLAGFRTDVDPFLPPLGETTRGSGSALTHVHNLRNVLHRYNVHPKSPDLDETFTAQGLLSWIRSLDHLRVPAGQLEAWLVHREPESGVSVPDADGDAEEGPVLHVRFRAGGESIHDVTLNPSRGASRPRNASDNDEAIKEEEEDQLENSRSLWREEEEFMVEGWRNTNPSPGQMFQETQDDRALSADDCLRFFNTSFTSDLQLPDPDGQNAEEHLDPFHEDFPSPPTDPESTFSLEQQWQDVLSIMELQDMDAVQTTDRSLNNMLDSAPTTGVDLHHQDARRQSADTVATNPLPIFSNAILPPEDSDIINLLQTPQTNVSDSGNVLPWTLWEQQSQFDSLLEEAMLDEVGLMDLALDDLETPHQAESDSGLSLNCSRSLSSPSGSDLESSSSSVPTLVATNNSIKEEEGAVGGYMEEPKTCRPQHLEARRVHLLPQLEQIDHDHTYNQPSRPRNTTKASIEAREHLHDRDESRAKAMKIPFPNECIVNLPVEKLNEMLAGHHLSVAQLALIRDIRRRGKNKMAAQNCRKRKLDVLVGLERNVDGLRRHRFRLLRENSEILRSVREMKRRICSLHREVSQRLEEERGLHEIQQERSRSNKRRRTRK